MSIPPAPSERPLIPDGTYLDFSSTGVAWLDALIDVLVVAGVVIAAMLGFYFKYLRPLLKKIATDAATAADMTANSHQVTANPNLRDDLDAKHRESTDQNSKILENQEIQARMLAEVIRAQHRHEKEIGRLNDAVADDREETRRVAQKLDAHVRQKAGMEPRLTRLETQLEAHRKTTEDP